MMKFAKIFLYLFVITLLLHPGSAQAQAPDRAPSVTSGQVLWGQNCAPCHGPTGQGDGPTAQAIENPLPDFTNPETARRLVPRENFEIIKNGRIENMMPRAGNVEPGRDPR
jgi:mono/diheme cytochrome c family protein